MKRAIISGGGTGGHVFPAIAIAHALRQRDPGIEILFIGANGRLEMTKVPAAGYPIVGLNISGLQRRLTWKNLLVPFKLAGSLLKAHAVIRKFRPDVVIGVGGYASGPTLRVASSMGIPCIIQEQNSYPGITNRLLGKRARRICVAYPGMEKFFPADRIVFTGNPIRQDLLQVQDKRAEAMIHFGLDPARKTLLVIGGSLGAGTINQAILKYVTESGNRPGVQVLWQTGNYYHASVSARVAELTGGMKTVVLPFIDRMDLAYAAGDLIVSRAGAIAISELCVVGKPAILIPSPNVAEDHQTHNARNLADRHAALMVTDATAVETLGGVIDGLLQNPGQCSELALRIRELGIPDAADTIAGTAMSMISPASVYFLGIGGIGMSALARYYLSRGAKVAGYDKTPSPLTDELTREGMQIDFTGDPKQIAGKPSLVVYTPAVPATHPAFGHFANAGIAPKKRAEVLGDISRGYDTIAVAGTHGKTTTSSMIAHILRVAEARQVSFLGGIAKNYGSNFIDSEQAPPPPWAVGAAAAKCWCVTEADEYDRSFLHLKPKIAVVTSADADHLDIYGDHARLVSGFEEFTGGIRANGTLILKAGTGIQPRSSDRYRVFSYSLEPGADFHPVNIRPSGQGVTFDLVTPSGIKAGLIPGIPGRFNLENAVAALAACLQAGIPEDLLREGLQSYTGVSRRFEFRVLSPTHIYIDDYAHHPEELRACISAARELFPGKKLTGIFQPHLYSRTRDLADAFAVSLELLDSLLLLDIYPAREEPIPGVTSELLLERVNLADKMLIAGNDLPDEIRRRKPEVLLTLGAGDIDRFADTLAQILTEGGQA